MEARTLVSIDGALTPPEEAVVSVFDRGFLYGDSVYEVLRTYAGRPFEQGAHLERLQASAECIGLTLPWPLERLGAELEAALAASGHAELGVESYLRLMVTRGAGEISLDPGLATGPRRVIVVRPLPQPPRETYDEGIALAVVGVRRNPRDTVDPAAKTGNYLNNVLALGEARGRGAAEAVMLDGEGRLTEGSSSNLFVVRGGVVLTPPAQTGILVGITRQVIFQVAAEAQIPLREEDLGVPELLSADEAFITSSIREILPATRCDGRPIGGGQVGPLTRALQDAFRARTGAPFGDPRF